MTDQRTEIERRRAEFVAAFNREDLNALREFCADDIVMMPPNQPPMIGVRSALEWWATGFEAGRTTMFITPRELYVTDGWATEWFDWSVRVVPLRGTAPTQDSGSTLCIWRRRHDDGWRILRTIWKSHSEVPSLWSGGVAEFPCDELPPM